jgi:hypothetical protein
MPYEPQVSIPSNRGIHSGSTAENGQIQPSGKHISDLLPPCSKAEVGAAVVSLDRRVPNAKNI